MEWKLFADLAETVGQKRVTVEVEPDGTIRDALNDLLESYPHLEERLFDEHGDIRDHINLLHNGTNVQIESERGLDTRIEQGDELALFPPVSGGTRSRSVHHAVGTTFDSFDTPTRA